MTDTPAEREDSSIWAELRRRRVAQWALAYAAGAWVLLQVLGFVSDSFAWPATVKQIATILLAIGLPIVVVLGWYHGDRGQQRVTGPELAVLTLLLFLGGGLLWVYVQRSVPTTTSTEAVKPAPASAATDAAPAARSPDAAPAPDEKSIAVLPFADMSAEKDQEYMADGIAEELLNLLAKAPDLKVIARTSSFAFKGKNVEHRGDREEAERRPRARR